MAGAETAAERQVSARQIGRLGLALPGSGIMSATGALGAVVLALFVGLGQFGLHKIPEGAVGVYYRGGAILPQTTEPGYHVMMPFVTRMQPMQVNIQSDLVRDIPCGTQGGTVIHFEKIEVVNRLRCDTTLPPPPWSRMACADAGARAARDKDFLSVPLSGTVGGKMCWKQ